MLQPTVLVWPWFGFSFPLFDQTSKIAFSDSLFPIDQLPYLFSKRKQIPFFPIKKRKQIILPKFWLGPSSTRWIIWSSTPIYASKLRLHLCMHIWCIHSKENKMNGLGSQNMGTDIKSSGPKNTVWYLSKDQQNEIYMLIQIFQLLGP